MIKMLQKPLRLSLQKKNIYVRKFQIKEDAKICYIARAMKRKGILSEVIVNTQGVTLIRKSQDEAMKKIFSLTSLENYANGRWNEFMNL